MRSDLVGIKGPWDAARGIFQRETLRLREAKQLIQRNTAKKGQSRDSNPDVSDSRNLCFFPLRANYYTVMTSDTGPALLTSGLLALLPQPL